jgi:hypothetical protein
MKGMPVPCCPIVFFFLNKQEGQGAPTENKLKKTQVQYKKEVPEGKTERED